MAVKKGKKKAVEEWERPAYLTRLKSAQQALEGGKKGKAKEYLDKAFDLAPDTYKRELIVRKIKRLGYNTSRYETEIRAEESGLPGVIGKLSPAFSIIFLASALILITFNLTGYAVGEAQNFTRWAGVICFVCGLIFSFIHVKTKK